MTDVVMESYNNFRIYLEGLAETKIHSCLKCSKNIFCSSSVNFLMFYEPLQIIPKIIRRVILLIMHIYVFIVEN